MLHIRYVDIGGADRTRTDECVLHVIKCPTRPRCFLGGADRTRTDDPLHAMQVLYQLSYNPGVPTYFIFLLAKCQIYLLIFLHTLRRYIWIISY